MCASVGGTLIIRLHPSFLRPALVVVVVFVVGAAESMVAAASQHTF